MTTNGSNGDAIVVLDEMRERLEKNPGELIMTLLPAKKHLGERIANSKRLIFKQRWKDVLSVSADVGVVVVDGRCDAHDLKRIKDMCRFEKKTFVPLGGCIGIGQLKKVLLPLMENWRPPRKPAPMELIPVPQPTPVAAATPTAAPTPVPVLAPKIGLVANGKVKAGELLALIMTELEANGVFKARKDPAGFKAAIERLVSRAKEEGFGPRTTRASIVNAYDRGSKKFEAAQKQPEPVSNPTPTPVGSASAEPVPAPDVSVAAVSGGATLTSDNRVARGQLFNLVMPEIEANGVFEGKKDPKHFKAAIDRLMARVKAGGFGPRTSRASVINAYSRAGKKFVAAQQTAAASNPAPAVTSPPVETPPASETSAGTGTQPDLMLAPDDRVLAGRLVTLVKEEISANGPVRWKTDPNLFKAAIDRIVVKIGKEEERPAVITIYELGCEQFAKSQRADEPAPAPAQPTAKPPATEAETEVAQEANLISARFSDVTASFEAALKDFGRLHREVSGLQLTARSLGRAELRGEARRQVAGLEQEVKVRNNRIGQLEAEAGESEAKIVRLESEIADLRRQVARPDLASRVADLEQVVSKKDQELKKKDQELKVYQGIEGLVPAVRIMREQAEIANRSAAGGEPPQS